MSEVSPLRYAIDPNSTLPPTKLEPINYSLKSQNGLGLHVVTYTGKETLGRACISENESGERYFSSVSIDTRLRGRGFGLSTYVAAIELAHTAERAFRTDDNLTRR